MKLSPTLYTIDIPAHGYYAHTIELAPGFVERILKIRAGVAAQVFILCTGTDIAGSLTLDICVEHPHAQIKVGIACTVRNNDHCVITSVQRHEAPHATSRLYVRKIISDAAVATYHGMIHITHNAVGSDVSQNDKTLLDGDCARAESIPAIEVLTDEVSCAHGSALGRIDADAVWYMQSRGISYEEATQLWYAAFLDEARVAVFE